jgi:hypothetical protein
MRGLRRRERILILPCWIGRWRGISREGEGKGGMVV